MFQCVETNEMKKSLKYRRHFLANSLWEFVTKFTLNVLLSDFANASADYTDLMTGISPLSSVITVP